MLSEAEQEQHEERKLKLRKAMGEAVHDAPPDETPDAAQRRLNLIRWELLAERGFMHASHP